MQRSIVKHHAKIEAWETFCQELGEKPADLALAWLLHSWSSGGRSRALIARRLDYLALSMQDGRDAAGRLPLSVGQQVSRVR